MPITASTSGNSANNESFSKATDYLAKKKYGDARRHLRKILDNDKNNARANMLLGDAYAGEGRTSDAKNIMSALINIVLNYLLQIRYVYLKKFLH